MTFMVVETFRDGNAALTGMRFRERGRMLPDEVEYLGSWMEENGARCFQLMQAPSREHLDPWIAAWDDLVAFEVTPVLTSAEFWGE